MMVAGVADSNNAATSGSAAAAAPPAAAASSHTTKCIVLYMPGASAIFSDDTNGARFNRDLAPALHDLTKRGCAGTLRLSDRPRNACNASHELAHLLGMDVTPRRDFAGAFHRAFPALRPPHVLTACADHHVLASDLSLPSTLVCANSWNPRGIAALASRTLVDSWNGAPPDADMVLIHLPYYVSGAMPENLCSPLSGPSAGHHQLHHQRGPPSSAIDKKEYIQLVNDILAHLGDKQHAPGVDLMVVLVLSWDEANLPKHLPAQVLARYDAIDAHRVKEDPAVAALKAADLMPSQSAVFPSASGELDPGIVSGIDDDAGGERGAKRAKGSADSAQARALPLAAVYYHPEGVRTDNVDELEVFKVYADGGNREIGTWQFLRELAFKVGAAPKYGA